MSSVSSCGESWSAWGAKIHDAEGFKPVGAMLQAMKAATTPSIRTELKSYLQMVN